MFGWKWRKRALEAEKAFRDLAEISAKQTQRATLLSIHRDGRRIVFTFAKNGEIHRISAIGSWDDDIEAWANLLIEGN